MTTCRRMLSGIARLTLCLALAIMAFTGQAAVSSPAHAQTADVRVYVYYGTGTGTYKAGTPITITAEANPPGYEFVKWIMFGGTAADLTKASTLVTPNANSSYIFALPQRRLIPSADVKYPLSVYNGTGSGAYSAGEKVAIAAPAVRGDFAFQSWYDPSKILADPTAASTTATMPASRALLFPFYVYAPGSAGDVAVSVVGGTGTGRLKPGATGTVVATVPANMVFDRWTSSIPVVFQNVNAATTTYTVPTAAVTITANFKAAVAPTFDVTVTGGTINGGPGTGKFKEGDKLTIKANAPAAGKEFDKWTGMIAALADATKETTVLTVGKTALAVTATYKDVVVVGTIDVTVTGGTINGGPGTGKFKEADKLTIKANAPAAGKVFDKWTGMIAALADATKETTVLTVGKTAVVVAATYKDAPAADVRVTLVSGVVVTPVVSGNYTPGTKIRVRANAAPAGQDFDRWTSLPAGVVFTAATASETEMTVPTAAVTVTATFKAAVVTGNAVSLTSHAMNDTITFQGETIFGQAKAPATVDTLEATVSTNGRKSMLEVDKVTGDFALRLFEGEVADGQAVTLTFARKDKSGATETSAFNLNGTAKPAVLPMIAGRLTFGATPALLNQLKTTGFRTWVEQQLAPAAINDAAFMNTNPDSILRLAVSEPGQLREEVPMWQMAYAAYSQRQLLEVMTVFWNNHFWSTHTDVTDTDTADIAEIRGFRTNAFGKFRDLLEVSAKSPQMMVFLDNIFSDANGINQNYARELFELHTVGVNGGYTTADIDGAARAFSGWGVRKTSADGVKPVQYVFEFNKDRHFIKEDRNVPYLNLSFPRKATAVAGDISEGEQILDRLAVHPATQEFICTKMVDLLVSDARPRNLIDKCKTAWQSSGGVIAESLRAIILDPIYVTSLAYQRTKAKTPFEAMAANLRNLGVYPVAAKQRDFYNRLRQIVRDSGMDMVGFTVPTGFKEIGSSWTNTASFIQKFRGATFDVEFFTSARSGGERRGTVNYTQMLKDAKMTTAESAAAYLFALMTADRFRKDEFDLVVTALKGLDLNAANAEDRLRRAVGLMVTLPSVQLQ